MDLRDYFAGTFAQAAASEPAAVTEKTALAAYQAADTLLEARVKSLKAHEYAFMLKRTRGDIRVVAGIEDAGRKTVFADERVPPDLDLSSREQVLAWAAQVWPLDTLSEPEDPKTARRARPFSIRISWHKDPELIEPKASGDVRYRLD